MRATFCLMALLCLSLSTQAQMQPMPNTLPLGYPTQSFPQIPGSKASPTNSGSWSQPVSQGSYSNNNYNRSGGSSQQLRSNAATNCPFVPSSDVSNILSDVKSALQAKSGDAHCDSLNQGTALLDGALRRAVENGFSTQDQGSGFGGVTCSNYPEMYTKEMNYILTAQAKGISYSSSVLSSNCFFQGDANAYQDCLEFSVHKAIEVQRLNCENIETRRATVLGQSARNELYQQSLAAATSIVSGSSNCDDKNVAKQVLRLGVGSFSTMASANPIGLAAVAGGQLLNALIDRFSNRSARFIKDLDDEETLANLQCLQLYVSRRALSCDNQTFQPQSARPSCSLSSDQFANLAQVRAALENVSALKSQERPNESQIASAMSLLSDALLRQTVSKGGQSAPLLSFVDTSSLNSPDDAGAKAYFEGLKSGHPLRADQLATLGPQVMKIKSIIDSALQSGANIDSLQRAEQYARIQSALNPSSDMSDGDADLNFLLSAHSKFTTAFRSKFMDILTTARERYQANQSNDSAREHFGMQLYRTCRMNAGAFMWGDQKGAQMSVSSPQRNPKYESLCAEFMKCNVANNKSVGESINSVFSLPPGEQSNAMQKMQCDLMNFEGDDLKKVRANLRAGQPPCG